MMNLIWAVIIIYNKFAIAAVPGAVQNIDLKSEFPDKRLKISFDKPITGVTNTFLKYRITVEPHFGGNNKPCIIQWMVVCSGCTGTNVGAPDSSTKTCSSNVTKNNAATYKSTDSSYSFIFNDEEIKPAHFYNVFIEAANTDGWGTEVKERIEIGHYKSSEVRNLTTLYNMTNDLLKVKWTKPSNQNGKVHQFQLWITDRNINDCLLWRKVTCGSCNLLAVGNKQEQNLSLCTDKMANLTFNEIQEDFEVNIEKYFNKILQSKYDNKRVTLNIVPINKYGWGTVTHIRLNNNCLKFENCDAASGAMSANLSGSNNDIMTIRLTYNGSIFYIGFDLNNNLCKGETYKFVFQLNGSKVELYGDNPPATQCFHFQFIDGIRKNDDKIKIQFNIIKMERNVSFGILAFYDFQLIGISSILRPFEKNIVGELVVVIVALLLYVVIACIVALISRFGNISRLNSNNIQN